MKGLKFEYHTRWYNSKSIGGDKYYLQNYQTLQLSCHQQYQEWEVNNDPYMPVYGFSEGYLVGKKNSERLSPYFRMDMGFKHKTKGRIFKIPYERFFQIINVTNYVNALNYQYRAKTNRNTEIYNIC